MLKGQCLHALYVSSVHVSDQHQNKYKYIHYSTLNSTGTKDMLYLSDTRLERERC
jgi:hypothetical protein